MKITKIFLSVLLLVIAIGHSKAIRPVAKDEIYKQKADSVLSLMTLDEKIGQMVLYTSNWDVTGPVMPTNTISDIKAGRCGNIFNGYTAAYTRELQEYAIKETRLGIPLLFGYDVIHGHKTIFPISLGEAASWDLEAIEKSARVAATEAAANGLHWTYAPMVDISRDPRWGRVSEGAGEDTYLGCRIAEARVRGFQGNDLASPSTVLACVKHFAAYGAPLAGRDYNTVDLSERTLREVYLPPYKAAIDAGALSIMTSFNELNGIPSSGNSFLLKDILRDEWGFKGFVVTDYTSINEMVPHGIVANNKEAAAMAVNAGVEMDMQGSVYLNYLKELVIQGKVSESNIDDAVRNILKLKFMLGLFDDPYRYSNEKREKQEIYSEENLKAAYDMACKSMVLLKNKNQVLPLNLGKKLAVIGPLANSKDDLLGSWRAAGTLEHVSSVLDNLKKNVLDEVLYAKGCDYSDADERGFAEALSIASKADVVVMVLGEPCNWSGEASSRTNINLPAIQTKLISEIKKANKPIVMVLMNGRPLALEQEEPMVDAILETWYAGTRGGEAIADVLTGEYNPTAKLPMTFPRNLGQVPIFYNMKNTGRPYEKEGAEQKFRSRYIDSSNEPLYPFGYGLSYTQFDYSDLKIDKSVLKGNEKLTVSVNVTNSGHFDGGEIVQLYIQDMVGSVTRPVKELKGFQKIFLKKGEVQKVEFFLTEADLRFYRRDMSFGSEPGKFRVFVGANSSDVLSAYFELED
jgi:beta-glucosidase